MQITQSTVHANGLSFGVRRCGDEGPLALCLHGFPDSARTWDGLLPELAAAGFRAVAPWTRGYAPTTVPADKDYSIAALAADANALHEALGGDSEAVLIGHDWGAASTYTAGAAAPDRWRRLVAMAVPPMPVAAGAFFRYEQLKRSFYVMLFQTPLAEMVAGADDLRFIERLWQDWSPGYDGAHQVEQAKVALRNPANLTAAIGYYRAMFTAGAPSDAPPQPTLYLHGTADGAFGADGVAGTLDHLATGSRMEIVDSAGHFLHLERPTVIHRMVIDWLGS